MDHLLKQSTNSHNGYAGDVVRQVESPLMESAAKLASQHIDLADEALRTLSDLHARLCGPQPAGPPGGGSAPANPSGQIDAFRDLQFSLGQRPTRLNTLAYELNGRI